MKLINADKFREDLVNKDVCDDSIVERYVCDFLDEYPTVEAVPQEKVNQAIDKIKKIINSGQFNEGVCFGLTHAMFLFKMMTMEEDGE